MDLKLQDVVINMDKSIGEFQIKKHKDGEVCFDTGVIGNMVTNGFYKLAYLPTTASFGQTTTASSTANLMYKCSVSTNTTEVIKTDTVLTDIVSFKVGTEYVATNGVRFPQVEKEGKMYYKLSVRYLWDMGALNNVTITKVGIQNSDNVLIAGQLIRDTSGTPVTVTVLADEQLDITYTIYVPILADITGTDIYTVNVNGVDHQYRVNLLLSNILNVSTTVFYFRGYYIGSETYRWTFLNSTGFNSNQPVKTSYDTSNEFTINLTVPVNASSFTPLNTISSGITYSASGASQSQQFVQYEFINSTLTKLPSDSLVFSNKVTITW